MKKISPISSDFGIIGLGTMGAALARNVESLGYRVSVYNRSADKVDHFLDQFGEFNFAAFTDLKYFVQSLKRPRKMMILVKAGPAVDAVTAGLLPYLEKGDVIIDGGNTYYKDTERRIAMTKEKGILYLGCGVSGGEEGALLGPSLMPGGSKQAWQRVKKILEPISADDFQYGPCVAYIGPGSAGHYVKMVHNGIEYAIMQLMAETYSQFRRVYGMSASEIADIFAKWNKGRLGSFLFEIAVPVLSKKDEAKAGNTTLIYKILDKASQKGTGKWTSLDALERGVAVPTITQAVYARILSGEKDTRMKLDKKYPEYKMKKPMPKAKFIALTERALYAAILSSFAQGFHLIQRASEEEKWHIDMAELCRIWQGGCIIRAKILKDIRESFLLKRNEGKHFLAHSWTVKKLQRDLPALRQFVSAMSQSAMPIPGFASSLFYIESMIERRLPANFIQGLRDYFGAHTYERVDREGSFHTEWNS